MLTGIKKYINMYYARGLEVTQLKTDIEFTCIKEEVSPTKLNVVEVDEHVTNIKIPIKTVKECTRCHIHRKPYNRYSRTMVSGCVLKSVKGLNQLPLLNGISQELSCSTLLTGEPSLSFNKVNVLNFGVYARLHRHNKTY